MPEFNETFTHNSYQSNLLLKNSEELYSQVFTLVVTTQLQFQQTMQSEFDLRKKSLVQNAKSQKDIEYLVCLNAQ